MWRESDVRFCCQYRINLNSLGHCILPGMTGPPNFSVGPVTLVAILYTQPAVDIRHSRRLPENSDITKLKRIFQVLLKTWQFSAGVNL